MAKNLKVLSIASKDTYKWLLEKHMQMQYKNNANSLLMILFGLL
jgi:hypothetical protein